MEEKNSTLILMVIGIYSNIRLESRLKKITEYSFYYYQQIKCLQ